MPVEAELGKIGGKEDDVSSDGDQYTDPLEAREYRAQRNLPRWPSPSARPTAFTPKRLARPRPRKRNRSGLCAFRW